MANQVTIASLLGSLTVSALLAAFVEHTAIFLLLPPWLLIRMGLATIDGTLAVDFGQKSRIGSVLNEVGDIVSDIVLIAPLALVVPCHASSVAVLVTLVVMCELAGIAGPALGGSRRLDGPFGKADRSIVLGIASFWIAYSGRLPAGASLSMAICDALAMLTIANRVRFARAGL
jgi:CDP-diacylglycerol--glycerol-3-phosphate 3-phosphatidyltransferase